MARDRPDWAMTASRLHCALVRLASVATTASVVLAPGAPLLRKAKASGGKFCGHPRPPNSPFCSKGAAQKCGVSAIVAPPAAFAAAIAATVRPERVVAEAEPMPPFRLTVVAPKPAPVLPRAKSAAAAFAAA